MAFEGSAGRRARVSPGRWSVGTLWRLPARAMVSRIWKRDSVHEVRGRTVIRGTHGAPAPHQIGGGRSMRLEIVFLIALADIFRLKSTGRTLAPVTVSPETVSMAKRVLRVK